jgi:hypothetical protein
MAKYFATKEPQASDAQFLVAFPFQNRVITAMDFERTPAFVCRGIRVGGTDVPPFNIGPGEIAKLIFPAEHAGEMDRVASALCAKNDDRIQAIGRIATVELPMPRLPLWEIFHRQTAAEWLIARCGMSRQDATSGLKRVDVHPDAPICALAGNPRWLIGFLAAIHDRPSAVVFSTIGCDPLGIQNALATAGTQLGQAAGVYLTPFPDLAIEEPDYATTVNVTIRERVMVA